MSKINQAMGEISKLEEMAGEDKWINNIHPLSKLVVTILYIAVVVSFNRYNIIGLLGMVIYLIVLFIVGEISFIDGLYRMRIVLPLVCFVGILNPFFDREIIFYIGSAGISSGVISMITLMVKGIFTVMAAYLFIISTTIEKICYSMRMVHIPKVIVTVIMLIYRYITVLMQEVSKLTQAYALRAPKQKGIHISAWGPLVGQLLLRSIDRAENVYESMLLRGFLGEIPAGTLEKYNCKSLVYMVIWAVVILTLRFVPVLSMIGSFFI